MDLTMRQHNAGGQEWVELSSRLRQCAQALTGSGDAAEELTQQTLAVLLGRQPDKATHLGYARKTLVRLWLDGQRSARRRMARRARLAAARARWHIDRDRPDDVEQVARIRAAAALLPPRQRAVLVLRLMEGLGYAQIAEALDCSVASVRSNLHLARSRIRRHLGVKP